MAQRITEKYSPSASGLSSAPRRHALAGRPKWVTIAATPLLLSAFFQSPTEMVASLLGFGLVAMGMWSTNQGLIAEAEYDILKAARRPAIPRKILGGLMAGTGFAFGAFEPGAAASAGLIGLTGVVMHLLAFGLDPMRNKGLDDVAGFQHQRVERMIEEGQGYLDQMRAAILRSNDRHLVDRVARFEDTVQGLFDKVRRDPGDLGMVRRYLGIYLRGARDATVKFSDIYARTQDQESKEAYETLLGDLERDFTARSKQLLEGDRVDLSVEISVLRERLARDGVPSRDVADPPALQSEAAQTMDSLLKADERPIKTR